MTETLVKGQRVNISKYLNDLKYVKIEIIYELDDAYSLHGSNINISAFCLTEEKKFLNNSYLINNKNINSPCNGLSYYRIKSQEHIFSFIVDFTKLNTLIKKIILVLSMGNNIFENPDYSKIFKSLEVRLSGINEEPFLRFPVTFEHAGESTMEIFEIYNKDFQWKIAAHSSSHIGGLSLLAEKYGVILKDNSDEIISEPIIENNNVSKTDNIINEPMDKKLKAYREKLLDLSKKNPLINTRLKSVIEFSEPDIYEIFEKLFDHSETLVLTSIQENQELNNLEKNEVRINRTKKEANALLYRIKHRASSSLEEQGINTLFIALGQLTWTEQENSVDKFLSPILLLPVELFKVSINSPYKLRILEDEIIINPALITKLINQFAIILPDLPEEINSITLRMYFSKLKEEIKDIPSQVLEEKMCLGIFSFNKLVLYNDLERYNELIKSHSILNGKISSEQKNESFSDFTSDLLDQNISSKSTFQVLDADSSQQEAIVLAKKGASFVLQGPPGTGKSQTITNIIAECISDGKSVLFVSEKMAALEVVKKRLENCGLGDFCLEMHGQKIVKKNIFSDLEKTLQLNKKVIKKDTEEELIKLDKIKKQLNNYVQCLHKLQGNLEISTYKAQSRLASLDSYKLLRFSIPNILNIDTNTWEEIKDKLKVISDLNSVFTEYENHPWKNTVLKIVSLENEGLVKNNVDNILTNLSIIVEKTENYHSELSFVAPYNIEALNNWINNNEFLLSSPFPLHKWLNSEFNLDIFYEKIFNLEAQVSKYKKNKSLFLKTYNISILNNNLLNTFEKEINYLSDIHNINLFEDFVADNRNIHYSLDILKISLEKLKVQFEKINEYSDLQKPNDFIELEKLEKLIELIILEPKIQSLWYKESIINDLLLKADQLQEKINRKNLISEQFTKKYNRELINKLPDLNEQYKSLYKIFSNNLPEHYISKQKDIEEIFISLNYCFEKLEKSLDSICSLCGIVKPENFLEISHYQELLENIIKEPKVQDSWFDESYLEKLIIASDKLKQKTDIYNEKMKVFAEKYKKDVFNELPEINSSFDKISDFFGEKVPSNFINEENNIKESLWGAKDSLDNFTKLIDNISQLTGLDKPKNYLEYEYFRKIYELIVLRPEIQESWYDDKNLSSLLLRIEEINKKVDNYKQKYQSFVSKYNKDILELDINKLLNRFEIEFNGIVKRVLNSAVYKSDFKQISSLLNNSNLKYSDILDILKAADLVYKEKKWFEENIDEFINTFGNSYIGENTDWNKIKEDVLIAKKIIKWFSGKTIPQKLKSFLENSGIEAIKFKKLFEDSEDNLKKFKKFSENLKSQSIEINSENIEKTFKDLLEQLSRQQDNFELLWSFNKTINKFTYENKIIWELLKVDIFTALEISQLKNYFSENKSKFINNFGSSYKEEETDWNKIKEDILVTQNILKWFSGKLIPEELKLLLKHSSLELKRLKQLNNDTTESFNKIKLNLDRFNKANIIIDYQDINNSLNTVITIVLEKRSNFNDLWSFYSQLNNNISENYSIIWNQLNEDFKQGFEIINFEKFFEESKNDLINNFGSCFNGIDTNWEYVKEQLLISSKIISWFENKTIPEKLKDLLKNANEINKFKQIFLDLNNIKETIEINFNLLNKNKIRLSCEEINEQFDIVSNNVLKEKDFMNRLCNLNESLLEYLKPNSILDWQQLRKDFCDGLDLLAFELNFSEQYQDSLKNELEDFFKGLDTDWTNILQIIDWSIKFNANVSKNDFILNYGDLDKLKLLVSNKDNLFEAFKQYSSLLNSEYNKLSKQITEFKKLFINEKISINSQTIEKESFTDIYKWFQELKKNFHYLNEWIKFRTVESYFNSINIGNFITLIFEQRIPVNEIDKVFYKRFYQLWLDDVYTREPLLSDFNGTEYNNLISDFSKLDLKSLDIARARLQVNLRKNIPEQDMFKMESSVFGILNTEMAKKRKHKPLRKLFCEIKDILFKIKPCFMMSPLSVSQFIDPEKIKFDLVIFDEASQIFPEDAVGAILRGNQLIVVGDKKQMPPSNFFRFVESDESDEYDEEEIPEYESILEECSNMGIPSKMLQWHYRSKDEHLIAFSNKHFYNNKLFTFPNKVLDKPAIEFIHVNGIYDRGGSRQNRIEAEKIADLVFEHLKKYNNKLTLGVITFSEAQQMAILSELERRRMDDQSFEALFESKDSERFFVKSIEHVQGDERDVILFSVGYGKSHDNKISYNFGPLKSTGGERRLNVAVTRARQHIKLVSSIRYTDLDLARINSLGSKLLRNYLEYAELGKSALYENQDVTEHLEFDSPFEEYVYDEIVKLGYIVRSQVGSSGYRIDLAVVDPENPGSFLLGVECDGATYHSSKTARDRDRLRQQVLESLGWKIHRIWSRDWVSNQVYEIEKIKEAIKQAISKGNRNDSID
ncbi:MAG: DUF4011 domain-containing protein, partial [Candidatus Sericytochromatia bacterium]|nr:DUF4011 domain-containing protein [Candidatus Sericytochromatia bacterium]